MPPRRSAWSPSTTPAELEQIIASPGAAHSPATRTCAWCKVVADAATMEPISNGPSVACKDTTACLARMDAQPPGTFTTSPGTD